MGYYITSDARGWESASANIPVRPKTLTPFHQSQGLGLRFYKPGDGRWVNRDPMDEKGGINIYAWVYNNSINAYDILGMTCCVKDLKIDYETAVYGAPGNAWFLANQRYTIIHHVQFNLELYPGGNPADCEIRQYKNATITMTMPIIGVTTSSDGGFVPDGGPWWDGTSWNGGNGMACISGKCGDHFSGLTPTTMPTHSPDWYPGPMAVFYDAPGFHCTTDMYFPLTWNVDFKTEVSELSSGDLYKRVKWRTIMGITKTNDGTISYYNAFSLLP